MKLVKFEKKKLLSMFFLVIIGIVICLVEPVWAVTVNSGSTITNVCFNRSTGAYLSTYTGSGDKCGGNGRDAVKYVDGIYAYCVNWKLSVKGKSYYAVDTSWPNTSKNAIMAGYIINSINGKGFSMPQAYANTAATLNTFFASSYINDSNSYSYSAFSNYITDAATYYKNNVNLSTKLPTINITTSSKVLNYTGSNYVSSKVTVSGLVSSYGGDSVSYKITTNKSDVVKLCTSSNGTNCQSSVVVPSGSSTYSFYIYVSASSVTSDDNIVITVSGSNKSTYPSSILYKNTVYSDSQKLLTVSNVSVSRSASQSYTFTVPNLVNHTIKGLKVNEYGESLNGSFLELYKDDVSVSGNLLKSNSGSGSILTYVSPTVASDDDDFFKHDYYLVEKSAPDGYVLSSSVNKFYLKDFESSSTKSTCYYNGENESDESVEAEAERCNFANYEYKCQSSEGEYLDLNEAGNCEFNNPTPEPEPEPGQGEGTGDVDTGAEGETTPDGATTEENTEPEVTYTKICYSNSKNSSVDESYCSDKGKYTLVTKSNGNLVVTQLNKKNSIKISKKAATGDEEVSGANLKICTVASYESSKENCEPAKTIDDVEMNWISGENPYEFVGVPVGSYYIIEVTPPNGYVQATTVTEFSIDETGSVKTGDQVITNDDFVKGDGAIVVKNNLNSISISKQDMATSKELPGATLSICRTYVDENDTVQLLVDQYTGDCIDSVLADGTVANWVSTNEPKTIEGLAAGTYYLVEKIAPTDYSTAEAILFTLKADGTLVDKDGNSLADNKLVMYDKAIDELETGSLSLYIVSGILVVVVVLGIGSYYYLNHSKEGIQSVDLNSKNGKKIRMRRIHK